MSFLLVGTLVFMSQIWNGGPEFVRRESLFIADALLEIKGFSRCLKGWCTLALNWDMREYCSQSGSFLELGKCSSRETQKANNIYILYI